MKYPIYLQEDIKSCGASCIKMVLKYYGQDVEMRVIKDLCKLNENGVTVFGIMRCLKACQTKATALKGNLDEIIKDSKYPYILHTSQNGLQHYIVIYEFKNDLFTIGDPAIGLKKISIQELNQIYTGVCISIQFVALIDKEYKNKNIFKFYFEQFLLIKYKVIKIFFVTLVIAILSVINTFYIQNIIDKISDFTYLNFIFITLFFYIINIIKVELNKRCNEDLLQLKLENMNFFILDTIQQLPYIKQRNISLESKSVLLNKINSLNSICDYLNLLFSCIFIDMSFLFFIILTLFFINGLIALVLMFCLIILFTINYIYVKKIYVANKKCYEKNDLLQENILEFITNIPLMKQYNCIKFYKNKIQYTFSKNVFEIKNKELLLIELHKNLSLISQTILYGIIVLSFSLFLKNIISSGTLLLIFMLVSYSFEPILKLASLVVEHNDQMLLFERYKMLLPEKPKKKKSLKKVQSITFDYVSYGYGFGTNILEDIDFTIDKSLNLIGEIGSGKSTFLQLIMNYDQVTKGQILINEIPIEEYDIGTIYNRIFYLPKTPSFFHESLAFNISLNDESKTESLLYLLRYFRLENLINELDKTVDIYGGFLSSGQQQLIMFIRVILKNPEVILIDEGFCNIDESRLKLVYQYISEFCSEKIIIHVSHKTKIVNGIEDCAIIKEKQIHMEK